MNTESQLVMLFKIIRKQNMFRFYGKELDEDFEEPKLRTTS